MHRLSPGRDLIHNSLFSGTDNLLGAGDTSILVLPYLNARVLSLRRHHHQVLLCLQSLGPGLLSAFSDRALSQGGLPCLTPPGNSRDWDLWTCEHRLRMVMTLEPPSLWTGHRAPCHSLAVHTGIGTKDLTDLVNVAWLKASWGYQGLRRICFFVLFPTQ